MENLVAIFKLNKFHTQYEVFDSDGLYEYSIEATAKIWNSLIDKGYKYQRIIPTSLSDAHIEACEIWAECDMPPVRQDINHSDWEQLTEMFCDLGDAILIGDHEYIQKFIGDNS
tara:strand:- start:211 stop:552 length:342 start_codon:yes stop_codon:yes gene_type:complete